MHLHYSSATSQLSHYEVRLPTLVSGKLGGFRSDQLSPWVLFGDHTTQDDVVLAQRIATEPFRLHGFHGGFAKCEADRKVSGCYAFIRNIEKLRSND